MANGGEWRPTPWQDFVFQQQPGALSADGSTTGPSPYQQIGGQWYFNGNPIADQTAEATKLLQQAGYSQPNLQQYIDSQNANSLYGAGLAQQDSSGTPAQSLASIQAQGTGMLAPHYNAGTQQLYTFDPDQGNPFMEMGVTALQFLAMMGSAGLASGAIGAGGAALADSGFTAGLGAGASGFSGAGAAGAGAGFGAGSSLLGSIPSAAVAGSEYGAGAGIAGGLGSSTAGVGGLEYGGNMAGDYFPDFPIDEGFNFGNYVGDIPTVGDVGGTSIYGANPSVADLYSQYQLSGQNPMDFLRNLSGLPNTPPGAQSLIQQAMKALNSGGSGGLDMTKLLGQLAATGLGIYGANRQSNQIGALSQQYAGYGAPYRAMLASSYADPAGFLKNSPDIQAAVGQGTDALARSLSTQGNPTGNGASLQAIQNYATQGLYGQLGNERNRLANFGGLSNFNAAAPGLAGQAITAQGGALNALGSGISSVTNPPTTLEQALNQINGLGGLKLSNGAGLA